MATPDNIRDTYLRYVIKHLRYIIKHDQSTATVVFDGYHGHLQPNPWSKIAGHPEHQLLILCSLAVCILRPLLEMEPTNLVLLLRYLDQAATTVEQATSGADTFVSTALELAVSGEAVVLVRTDTDLLVMLVARNAKLMQSCFCFVPV